MAALALARAGDTARAEKLVAELDRTFPLDTLVQRYWLPTIRAALALLRKDPNRAIELLKVASTVELGEAVPANLSLCPVYVRGDAYVMLHDGKAAAAEFQKFIDHYGIVVNFPWGALARLGLARAYALQADTDPAARDNARTAYQNFLALWKDADPDIPIYQQAKAEYQKLQNTTPKSNETAQSWLKLVDSGDYSQSWVAASSQLKSAVTEQDFERQLNVVRGAVGPLLSRKLKSAEYRTTLPGAPDGQYFIFQYDSRFAGKASAVETVTTMLDKDGQWRVSGYFIR